MTPILLTRPDKRGFFREAAILTSVPLSDLTAVVASPWTALVRVLMRPVRPLLALSKAIVICETYRQSSSFEQSQQFTFSD
jgi:hypothetical protein